MPGAQGNYARFYAMGIDSLSLLPQLSRMRDQPERTFNGKTGSIYMNRYQQLHRQLAWAEISKGQARIVGYAPRFDSPQRFEPETIPQAMVPNEQNLQNPAPPPAEAGETKIQTQTSP
jgi:hypothetical protein